MTLNLPEPSQEALRILLALSPEDAQLFERTLREAKPALWPEQLAEAVASTWEGTLEGESVARLVHAIVGFYISRASMEMGIVDYVAQIRESMEALGDKSLLPADGDWSDFEARLGRLLDIEQPVEITAKAADVLLEHDHPFYSARIMTDLRPIYSGDPSERPAAAVITHTLKIVYQDRTRQAPAHFYVVLDSGDIQHLKELLTRAEEKGRALTTIVEQTGMTLLGPREG